MTAQAAQSPQTTPAAPDNSKEINFRAQERAMKDHYERQLAQREAERDRLLKELEAAKRNVQQEEEEDDPEPYVDKKKLVKTLTKFEQKTQQQTQSEIQKAIAIAKEEAKREAYLENNPDFNDILSHAEKIYQKSPALANSLLAMPDNFERQKLVVQTIKELGLHKPPAPVASIQDKVNANQRGQFYQPSNVASAPYQGQQSDFSKTGQESAYKKMQELISNKRF